MKERPILFSGPMVRAILDNRKTVTRRVVKPQPDDTYRTVTDGVLMYADECGDWHPEHCPYGQPGDRLWVRETFWIDDRGIVVYAADGAIRVAHGSIAEQMGLAKAYPVAEPISDARLRDVGYTRKPSIFMPRWASRITLEVVSVRVERLREITEDDAEREGFDRDFRPDGSEYGAGMVTALDEFRALWDKLNAERGFPWESNPYVRPIEFRRVTP